MKRKTKLLERKLFFLVATLLIAASFAANAVVAHWEAEDGHKMHYPQLPQGDHGYGIRAHSYGPYTATLQTPISGCCDPPDGIVAWWPLDEVTGNISDDIEGNNDGTWNGSPQPVGGVVDGALYVPGFASYVNVPDSSVLNFDTGDFSIDCWILQPSTDIDDEVEMIIDKRAGTASEHLGYALMLNAEGKLAMILGTGSGYIRKDSDLQVLPDEWTFIAATLDRESDHLKLRLYVNHDEEAFGITNFTSTVTNSGDLWIGRDHFIPNHSFGGYIDEVELFDRALFSSEIYTIFETGSSGKCKGWCLGTTLITLLLSCGLLLVCRKKT